MTVLAALDVGSNTIRTLIAQVDGDDVRPIQDLSNFVRLGAGVDSNGVLDPERMDDAIEAIQQQLARAHELHAEDVRAIATSAVREARNGTEFVERVRREAGVSVEVISGEREAELTYRGAALGIDLSRGAIVVDLGGGSSEIIAADSGGMRWGKSLPLGSGRLTERYVSNDPPGENELTAVARGVNYELANLPAEKPETVIFTGGTASHVARLLGGSSEVTNVGRGDLAGVRRLVAAKPARAVSEETGIRLERAQVLPAGVRALEAIADHYAARQIVITQHGIREGLLREP